MKTLLWLLRREIWENKLIWAVPAVGVMRYTHARTAGRQHVQRGTGAVGRSVVVHEQLVVDAEAVEGRGPRSDDRPDCRNLVVDGHHDRQLAGLGQTRGV